MYLKSMNMILGKLVISLWVSEKEYRCWKSEEGLLQNLMQSFCKDNIKKYIHKHDV